MVERKTLSVAGMSCDGCERNVESALQTVAGVRKVEADHAADAVDVVVEDGTSDDELARVVHDAGYDVGDRS